MIARRIPVALLIGAVVFGLMTLAYWFGITLAHADGSGSAIAGSGSAVSLPPGHPDISPAPAPETAPQPAAVGAADKLHDPVSAPSQAYDDVKAAKKTGWAVAVFAVLVMLARLAGRARNTKALAWLGKGRTAVIVAAAGALLAACYNAAADGGSWTAILAAGVTALAAYWNAHAEWAPPPKGTTAAGEG